MEVGLEKNTLEGHAKPEPEEDSTELCQEEDKICKESEDGSGAYAIDEDALALLDKQMSPQERESSRERAYLLKQTGNDSFKAGQYSEAVETYTEAIKLCPVSLAAERAVLYSNRGATWARLGKSNLAVEDCSKAIELNPAYLKPVLKRAQLHKEADDLDKSLQDYQRVLELDPSIIEAQHACTTLPNQIKERNEKLQAEMIGKLKELGNLVLKPFGMSTDNFKLMKDGEGGGYKIQFQK